MCFLSFSLYSIDANQLGRRLRKENNALRAQVEVVEIKERGLGSPMHGR